MAYGIGSIVGDVEQKADVYRAKPDALAQLFQQNQQLVDLLALQKLKSEKDAAIRDMQMKAQAPAATIKDQREQEMLMRTKQELAQQIGPGLAMAGQQMQQAQGAPQPQPQQMPTGGLASLPAANLQPMGMARGGIVGYAPGGQIELSEEELAALPEYERSRLIQRAWLDALARGADPSQGSNALRDVQNARNSPPPAREGIASVLSEGTPERDIPMSMDALRQFDARREAERVAGLERRRNVPTGDPIADNILASRRATEYMTPEQAEYLRRSGGESSRPSRLMDDLGAAAVAEGGMGIPDSLRGAISSVADFGRGVASESLLPSWLEEQLGLLIDPRKVFSGVKSAEEYFPRARAAGLDNAYGLGALLGETVTAPFKAARDFLYPDPNLGYATLGDMEEFGRGVVGMDARATPSAAETAAVDTQTVTTPASLEPQGLPPLPDMTPYRSSTTASVSGSAGAGTGNMPTYTPTSMEEIVKLIQSLQSGQAPQQAAPPAQSPYDAQLANVRAQQQNKLQRFAEFLRGGAGTRNLGVTMASASNAAARRDERLRGEESALIDKIEALRLNDRDYNMEERKLAQDIQNSNLTNAVNLFNTVESGNQFGADFGLRQREIAQKEREIELRMQQLSREASSTGALDPEKIMTMAQEMAESGAYNPELVLPEINAYLTSINKEEVDAETLAQSPELRPMLTAALERLIARDVQRRAQYARAISAGVPF